MPTVLVLESDGALACRIDGYIVPGEVADRVQLTGESKQQIAAMMAEYRSGNFAETLPYLETIESIAPASENTYYAYLIRAIVTFNQGKKDDALKYLASLSSSQSIPDFWKTRYENLSEQMQEEERNDSTPPYCCSRARFSRVRFSSPKKALLRCTPSRQNAPPPARTKS